jgi:hypothetical protein
MTKIIMIMVVKAMMTILQSGRTHAIVVGIGPYTWAPVRLVTDTRAQVNICCAGEYYTNAVSTIAPWSGSGTKIRLKDPYEK